MTFLLFFLGGGGGGAEIAWMVMVTQLQLVATCIYCIYCHSYVYNNNLFIHLIVEC